LEAEGVRRFDCEHSTIVSKAKVILRLLNDLVEGKRYPEDENGEGRYLDVFMELSDKAKFEICVLIAILKCNIIKKHLGVLGGLELLGELVRGGYL
jgi:hypothetical protein